MAENVTSDGHNRSYTDGDINLITGHVDGRYYGYVAVMTGSIDPRKASDLWPQWAKDTVVHEAIAVTKIHPIPVDLIAGNVTMNGLRVDSRASILNYLLRRG